jgi:hypothetical protein
MDASLMQPPRTLEDLSAAICAKIGPGAAFQCLNTRLIIQFGVNLKAIAPTQNADPVLLQRVQDALGRMGIRIGEART